MSEDRKVIIVQAAASGVLVPITETEGAENEPLDRGFGNLGMVAVAELCSLSSIIILPAESAVADSSAVAEKVGDGAVETSERSPAQKCAEELWMLYVAGREHEIRDRLVVQYGPLVKYVVGRLAITLPTVMDSDDVLSYGVIGLIDALDRFDPSRGIKFESYAIPRIRGSIIDALRSLDPLSRTDRDRARETERAHLALESQLGRAPSDEEVALQLGVSIDRYHQHYVRTSVTVLSLDRLLDVDDDSSSSGRCEYLEDKNSPTPPGIYERKELFQRLSDAIERLPEREKLILSLYYNDELTMKEISRVLEISESRVCQLHSQAILRLKSQLRDRIV